MVPIAAEFVSGESANAPTASRNDRAPNPVFEAVGNSTIGREILIKKIRGTDPVRNRHASRSLRKK